MNTEMITITAVVSKSYFKELMKGSEPFNGVEWNTQPWGDEE